MAIRSRPWIGESWKPVALGIHRSCIVFSLIIRTTAVIAANEGWLVLRPASVWVLIGVKDRRLHWVGFDPPGFRTPPATGSCLDRYAVDPRQENVPRNNNMNATVYVCPCKPQ